jgi:hypothetical protein
MIKYNIQQMSWLKKYAEKLKQNPMKISLFTVLILFVIKILFSVISGAIHANHFSYVFTSLFEIIVYNLVYRFFFWFIIGASLYEYGMRLKNSELKKALKKRTVFYVLLGIIAAAIANWSAILPLIALAVLAYLSYFTGQKE